MLQDKCFPTKLNTLKKEFSDASENYNLTFLHTDELKYNIFIEQYKNAADDTRQAMIFSLTKYELESFISCLPEYMGLDQEADIFDMLSLRYRRYVFRRMYFLWQDNYLNPYFCSLFARLLDHEKSLQYAKECGYKPLELKNIIISPNAGRAVLDAAQKDQYGLIEYLNVHYIHKGSHIALDAMSVFYLFCSEKDYIEIGDLRLSLVIERFAKRAQLRILKNMIVKISKTSLDQFPATLLYFIKKYYPVSNDTEVQELLGDVTHVFERLALESLEEASI